MPARPKTTAPDPWLSLPDAAEYLGVCTKTLRRYIAEGKLPAQRLTRAIRIRRADVDAMLSPVLP